MVPNNPGRKDALLNPRGEVRLYNANPNEDVELSPGANPNAYRGKNLALERAKERQTTEGFEREVQTALEVLRAVDRQALFELQRRQE